MHRGLHIAALSVLALATAGCVTRVSLPQPLNAPTKSATQIAEEHLLDVGVRVFDANVPTEEKQLVEQRINPTVRGAEARFIPVRLAGTLENSGYWGQVRVVPNDYAGMDLYVGGVILHSNGSELKLDVRASDATGRVWLKKVYEGEADTRSYKPGTVTRRDPFQNVYVKIADELAAMRNKLTPAQLTEIRRVAQLRFDAEMAPYAFKDYLKHDKNGRLTAVRLPAEDDPLANRLEQVRERDYALLDTLHDQYSLGAESINISYLAWRRSNHEEMEIEKDLRSSARTRMLMGAAAVAGGIAAAESGSVTGDIVGLAGVGLGIEAIRSGMGQRAEAKTHAENMKQLTESLSSELEPVNVQVEGQVLELRGTAEQQFSEWRRLLKELYEDETG